MGTLVDLRQPGRPAKVSIYTVQPYWMDRGRLGAGRLRQFRTEREARVAARAMVERYYQAEVSVVRGYPASDCWDHPVLLDVALSDEATTVSVSRSGA